ncbi:helix-turn-helix domain-containing protein [Jiella pelagia]|uniref:Helix-turn-helix domain-containing protein n=1 Tax=Jiella pelagia TaxID=2986949 RepID=A0ABY7C354_9HYPH|nr:helix-turn-helix domain-containing protein [Jiella pelagia]WAP69295.1 helix-turn-helix domain-containing protein [Jiella pelagia]
MADDTEPLDLVWGVAAIAKLIGRSERQTYDMLSSGHLPAKQVGQRWVAKRDALTRFFEETAA